MLSGEDASRDAGFPFTRMIFGSGALAVLLTYFGWGKSQPPAPPGTSPPASPHSALSSGDGDFTLVEQSSWQDPFQTLLPGGSLYSEAHSDQPHKDLRGPEGPGRLIKQCVGGQGDLNKLMLLVATVSDSTSSSEREEMRRLRHAIELGLSSSNFAAPSLFRSRMGLAHCPNIRVHHDRQNSSDEPFSQSVRFGDPKSEASSGESTNINFAYRLYHRKSENKSILLLYVPERELGVRPLDAIGQLTNGLIKRAFPASSQASTKASEQMHLGVLGPLVSDSLKEMVGEGKSKQSEASLQGLVKRFASVNVFNYKCTLPDQALGLTDHSPRNRGVLYQPAGSDFDAGDGGAKSSNRIRVRHVIADDGRLVYALRDELTARGVWPAKSGKSRMVLFVEQGSFAYLEAIREQFTQMLGTQPMIIPYLRGIASLKEARRQDRTPEVQDYLNRTVTEIWSRRRLSDVGTHQIDAVGVFGSLWEDKALIVKQTKALFPTATFFTTVMDARYAEQSDVLGTRNLVVASHYGLRVNGTPSIFGSIQALPSFRDSYQTSACLATSIAAYAFVADALDQPTLVRSVSNTSPDLDLYDITNRGDKTAMRLPGPEVKFLFPLTFEVGRYSPILLERRRNPVDLPLRQPSSGYVARDLTLVKVLMLLLVLLLVGVAVLAPHSDDVQRITKLVKAVGHEASSKFGRFKKSGGEYWASMLGDSVSPLPQAAGSLVAENRPVDDARPGRGPIAGSQNPGSPATHVTAQNISDKSKSEVAFQPLSVTIAIVMLVISFLVVLFYDEKLSPTPEPIQWRAGVSLWTPILLMSLVTAFGFAQARSKRLTETYRSLERLKQSGSPNRSESSQAGQSLASAVLTGLMVVGVLIFSYLQSAFSTPPARDAVVRYYAIVLFCLALPLVLYLTWRSFIFSLHVRDTLEQARRQVKKAQNESISEEMAAMWFEQTRQAMIVTIRVGRRLFGPAILALVLIIARLPYWDSWALTPIWTGILAFPATLALLAAFIVRQTTIRLRRLTLETLDKCAVDLQLGKRRDEQSAKRILESAAAIRRLDDGPFGPLGADGLLGATLSVGLVFLTGPARDVVSSMLSWLGGGG